LFSPIASREYPSGPKPVSYTIRATDSEAKCSEAGEIDRSEFPGIKRIVCGYTFLNTDIEIGHIFVSDMAFGIYIQPIRCGHIFRTAGISSELDNHMCGGELPADDFNGEL
jgi:hypothetical protein